MKFTFHPEAHFELEQTVEFYEKQQPNLGIKFLAEVYSSIKRIIEFPDAYPVFTKNTQRCLTNRFPYSIIYKIKQNEIFIVAVTHIARKPGYWKERAIK